MNNYLIAIYLILFTFGCNSTSDIKGLWITKSIQHIDSSVIDGIDTVTLKGHFKDHILSRYKYGGDSKYVFNFTDNEIESFRCNVTHYQLCIYNGRFEYSKDENKIIINKNRPDEHQMSIMKLDQESLVLKSDYEEITTLFYLENIISSEENIKGEEIDSFFFNSTILNNKAELTMKFESKNNHSYGGMIIYNGSSSSNMDSSLWSLSLLGGNHFLSIEDSIYQILSLKGNNMVLQNELDTSGEKYLFFSKQQDR